MLELRIVKPLLRRRGNLGLRAPFIFILLRQILRHLGNQPSFSYFWLNFHRRAINVFQNTSEFIH